MTRRRFFSDFYDSVEQRRYFPAASREKSTHDALLGRLRLDTLLSETLVVLDTQVLDGLMFLALGPDDLSSLIARGDRSPPPIEIRSRAPSLDEALLAFFRTPGLSTLRPFSLSVVPDSCRGAVSSALETTDASSVTRWGDLLAILESAGVSDLDLERIGRGWSEWTAAAAKGLVQVRAWDGVFEIDEALARSYGIRDSLLTETGLSAFDLVVASRHDRSHIDHRLAEMRKECADELALQDIKDVLSWFNSGYNCAAAWQNACDGYESIESPSARLHMAESACAEQSVSASAQLDVPGDLLERLGRMNDDDYRRFCYKQEDNLRLWWDEDDGSAFMRALDALVSDCSCSGTRRDTSGAWRSMTTIGGAIAGYFVGGPLGAAVGSAAPLLVEFGQQLQSSMSRRITVRRIMSVAMERSDPDGCH